MKLSSKREKVKAYIIKEEKLFWNSSNEVYNNEEEVIFKSDTLLQSLKFDNPFLFISDIEGSTTILGEENINLEGVIIKKRFSKDSLFVSKEGSTKILSLKNGPVFTDFIEDRIFTFLHHNDVLYYKNNKTKILACTIPTTEYLWQYNLSELGSYIPFYEDEQKPFEVDKLLGVWENELIIACNGGLLLAIDKQTGVITREWKGLPDQADDYLHEVFRGQLYQRGYVYQMNQTQTRIDAFFLHYYFYIDLESGKMHLVNCKDNLKKYQIEKFKYSSAYAEDEVHILSLIHISEPTRPY